MHEERPDLEPLKESGIMSSQPLVLSIAGAFRDKSARLSSGFMSQLTYFYKLGKLIQKSRRWNGGQCIKDESQDNSTTVTKIRFHR